MAWLDFTGFREKRILPPSSLAISRDDVVANWSRLEERFEMFSVLLQFFVLRKITGIGIEDGVIIQAKKKFPNIPPFEVELIGRNFLRFYADSVLLNAIVMGGEVVSDADGRVGRLYVVREQLGSGGMGDVHNGYFLKDGVLINVAIKEFASRPLPPPGDPKYLMASSREKYRLDVHIVEAMNAKQLINKPSPFVVTPIFVGRRSTDTCDVLVYERITMTDGHSADLDTLSRNRLVQPADGLHILAGVSLGIDHLHNQNIIHGDISLANTFVRGSNSGVLGDFSAMCSLHDDVQILNDEKDDSYYLLRQLKIGGRTQPFDMPGTSFYVDLVMCKHALDQGKSLKVIDYYALGVSILFLLYNMKLITLFQDRTVQVDSSSPQFVLDAVWLAKQLMDVTNPSVVISLPTIAKILNQIAMSAV